jgi:hypothetical protein
MSCCRIKGVPSAVYFGAKCLYPKAKMKLPTCPRTRNFYPDAREYGRAETEPYDLARRVAEF